MKVILDSTEFVLSTSTGVNTAEMLGKATALVLRSIHSIAERKVSGFFIISR